MSTKPVKSRFICQTLTHPMNTMCWRWDEKKKTPKNIFCLNKSCDHIQLQTFRSLPVRKVSAISISCCSVFSWHPFGGGEGWCLFVRKLIELLLSPILWVSLWAGTHFSVVSAAIVMENWPRGVWESGGREERCWHRARLGESSITGNLSFRFFADVCRNASCNTHTAYRSFPPLRWLKKILRLLLTSKHGWR